jgi:phosphomannomutase
VIPPLRFGTSGWRGVIAEEVTFPRARAFVAGAARWLVEQRARRVLVGHDTRFLGPELAGLALAGLEAAGLDTSLAASPVPTPVVAHAVRHGRADAALVFTASHNPAEYQGVKVIGSWGGGVGDEQARSIEVCIAAETGAVPPRAEAGRGPGVDLATPYVRRLVDWIDRDAFRGSPLGVVYDAIHGTGSGVCDRALRMLGVRVRVVRGTPSPRFGGGAPDPVPERLGDLVRRVRDGAGAHIGIATDGDADRYAVVDVDGRLLTATEALALLVDRLARTGRLRRGVALSIATGSLVERIAGSHGLAVTRHPIGFKHLGHALAAGEADVAGEESGGFAVEALARDKDGILACALLAETAAAARAPLRRRLRELARRHGAPACTRMAIPAESGSRARLARLLAAPPDRVGGSAVRAVDARDGLRLAFDDGFLLLRASGTEPMLRLYAEAPDPHALARRFAAARALLVDAARAPR